jgi:hypothetical protein
VCAGDVPAHISSSEAEMSEIILEPVIDFAKRLAQSDDPHRVAECILEIYMTCSRPISEAAEDIYYYFSKDRGMRSGDAIVETAKILRKSNMLN